jgi:hypothetical protein
VTGLCVDAAAGVAVHGVVSDENHTAFGKPRAQEEPRQSATQLQGTDHGAREKTRW